MIKLEKVSYYLMLAVVFLTPLAFISPSILTLDYVKVSIFVIGTSLAFIGIAAHAFSAKKIVYPRGLVLYAPLLILAAFIFSSISNVEVAKVYRMVFGDGAETTTLWFAFLAVAFVYSLTILTRTKERIFSVLIALAACGIILALLHVLRLVFGADFLSFGGLLNTPVSNVIGQWNDVGVYFGFTLLLSYLGLEFMVLTKPVKILLYVLGALSLAMVLSVGFTSVWHVLLAVSLITLLYSWKRDKKVSVQEIIFAVLMLLLVIFGTSISKKISDKAQLNRLDVRPSWALTLNLIGDSLNASPLFGVGPNRFGNQYLLSKPGEINQTVFWAIDFTSGISYVVSFAVTLGGFGILAILFALAVFVTLLVKAYRADITEPIDRFMVVAGAVILFYFVIIATLYNPSYPIIILTLAFVSLFLSGLRDAGILKLSVFEGTTYRRGLIIQIISVIGVVLFAMVLIYGLRRTVSVNYMQKALSTITNTKDIDATESNIKKALDKSRQPSNYVALAEISVSQINKVLTNAKQGDQNVVVALKKYLDQGIESAQAAIKLDPLDYRNYISQARVYESVISAQVPGAYENAMKSYASASALNPNNPSVFLSAAQLEVAMRKLPEAKNFIGKALQVKNNYSDAVFLLSQIQVAENSIKDAVNSLLYLAQINPDNPVIYFQLGLLYYNNADYQSTIVALNKAVELSDQYSNARYFLGLSLARLGRYADAANQFAEIQKYNPDNQEVADILTALRANRSPFTTVKSPEKGKTPPVKDSIDKKTTTKVKTR